MAEKILSSRIVHKHDVAENWSKAIGFTPMAGELIVYDIDDNHAYERIKIGDGQRNVNALPFVDDALRAALVELINAVDGKVDTVSALVGDTSVNTQIANAIASKSDVGHKHDDVYYTESEIDTKLGDINATIEEIVDGSSVIAEATHAASADSATHATSADNATKADSATSADSATKATKDSNNNIITDTYETKTDASAKLTAAKAYTDAELGRLVGDTTVSEQIAASNMIHVGPTEPTDSNIQVWINTAEESTGIIPVLPRIATVNLAATNWVSSGELYKQSVTVNGITANSKVDLQPTSSQIASLQAAEISLMIENNGGVLTCYAIGNKPAVDYAIQILIQEVAFI
jgi:hypothetical protein